MEPKRLDYYGRTFSYTDQPMSVPKSAVEHMLGILNKWQEIFPREKTYVCETYGVPSIIVRFDGVINADGGFDAYEIQSGCGWVGYAGLVNETFRALRDDFLKNRWPPFKLLASSRPLNNPDELFWLERIDMATALESDTPVWLRYDEWELPPGIRDPIIARSLKPVRTHNTKDYGVALGWWKEVTWDKDRNTASLPWDESFVLKPKTGFGSKDIMLWQPDERRGRATGTQIESTLARRESMYLQRFIPPMSVPVGGTLYNVILRPFFGYDPQTKTWIPMHGVWTGRPSPNLRIHGASDALSGPLYME